MEIKEVKRINSKIKKFEEEEWLLSDMEHYGKSRNFVKEKFKFVAQNRDNDILAILDLVIEANVSFLEGLLVGYKHQRKGIGKKILLFAEDFAKQKKCTKIWTETDEDWGAAKFYKKMGYTVCGVHEKHYLGKRGIILSKFFRNI